MNLGGQLMTTTDVDRLRTDIREGRLNSWKEIHKRYNDIWKRYPHDKLGHAYLSLGYMMRNCDITADEWRKAINAEIRNQEFMCEQVYLSRKKDYDNIYRQATYRNAEEMQAALGTIEDNSFVQQTRVQTAETIEALKALLGTLK